MRSEPDDKPGYVVNDHLSNSAVTDRLKRPTWKQSGPDYRFRFGLASSGVYMASPVTRRSVGSYPAFPPLLENQRYISVALSLESPPPDVIRHPALWSPDFPLPPPFGPEAAIIYPTLNLSYLIKPNIKSQYVSELKKYPSVLLHKDKTTPIPHTLPHKAEQQFIRGTMGEE